MTSDDSSRYGRVTRRTALTGALGAALLALAACGSEDSGLTGSGAVTPASSPSTDPGTAPSSTASGKAGKALPAAASLAVSFTFAPADSGGRVRNPYIAVWIEDAAGALVKTVALWHEDHGGQDRWLSEMKAFSALGSPDAQTVSSATRQPGAYTVSWDGTTVQGARATAGTYRVFIEAAREHGPYELAQQDVTLGAKASTFALSPSGELTAANAAYTV